MLNRALPTLPLLLSVLTFAQPTLQAPLHSPSAATTPHVVVEFSTGAGTTTSIQIPLDTYLSPAEDILAATADPEHNEAGEGDLAIPVLVLPPAAPQKARIVSAMGVAGDIDCSALPAGRGLEGRDANSIPLGREHAVALRKRGEWVDLRRLEEFGGLRRFGCRAL